MANFTPEDIEQALTAKAKGLTPEDVRRIGGSRSVVMKMVKEFPNEWSQARRQATLLIDLIEASSKGQIDVQLSDLKIAAGALVYLGDPLDIIPDDEEDGYADDAAIVALAVKRSEAQVRLLCKTRNLDPADYFD